MVSKLEQSCYELQELIGYVAFSAPTRPIDADNQVSRNLLIIISFVKMKPLQKENTEFIKINTGFILTKLMIMSKFRDTWLSASCATTQPPPTWPARTTTAHLARPYNHRPPGQPVQPPPTWPARTTTAHLSRPCNHTTTAHLTRPYNHTTTAHLARPYNHRPPGPPVHPPPTWPARATTDHLARPYNHRPPARPCKPPPTWPAPTTRPPGPPVRTKTTPRPPGPPPATTDHLARPVQPPPTWPARTTTAHLARPYNHRPPGRRTTTAHLARPYNHRPPGPPHNHRPPGPPVQPPTTWPARATTAP
ncbi:formin-like protein 7 [Penaeus monodon]|uniref:formin-like protein 7 n=1 Tax=Penaeus monodon TaxID=6687 RepID=UPI0018A75024|nr:formin-like protein 7 [Penaeus monodon]